MEGHGPMTKVQLMNMSQDISHNGSDPGGMMHMMMHAKSTFSYYTPMTPMLFKDWTLSTIIGLVLAMIATFIFAILYEVLRYYVYVHGALQKRGEKCPKNASKYLILSRITGTLLHMLHFSMGYLLMLAAMTFNVWIFLSLVIGATLGYFFIKPTIENHFKIIRNKRDRCGSKRTTTINSSANGSLKNGNIVYNARYTLIQNNNPKPSPASKQCEMKSINNGVQCKLLEERMSVV